LGILIRGGTVISPDGSLRRDVLIEGELISQVAPAIPAADHEIIDAEGLLLMPGGIDVHTHLELPVSGTISSDDFYTGHVAAAFGGTTSHIDFAIQPKGGSLADGLALWHEKAASKAAIDYSFHANITDFNEELLSELSTLPDLGITSVKLLMSYKGVFQVDDTALFRVMQEAAKHDLLVMVHAENGDVVAQLTADAVDRGDLQPHHHLDAHPPEAEAEATGRAAYLAGLSGASLFVVHVTCAGALEQIALARARGVNVLAETCTQYLALFKERLLPSEDDPFSGAKYVCSPPLRTSADAALLLRSLDDGLLQLVSTDHCPFFYESGSGQLGKRMGEESFTMIPNGLPGIEDRMAVTWQIGVNGGHFSQERFVALTSTNPARIFGLYPRKGVIQPGSDADILLWDPDLRRTISAAGHHMNTDYNPYEGMEVVGSPARLFLRGRLIVDGRRWLGQKGSGQFLPRTKATSPL